MKENKNKFTIEDIVLIKIERKYNLGNKETYFYNLKVSGIDELLLHESNEKLDSSLIGVSFKGKFNKDKTELLDFDII